MEQQKDKTGPKGPRNKVKQVILIEGHPESIFYNKDVEMCSIKLHKGYLRLGSLGVNKIKELRALLGKRVVLETRTRRCRRGIPDVVSIKTTKTSTSLTIGAVDQEALDKRVMKIAELLGTPIQERCKWVCEIDKGKDTQQAYDLAAPLQTTTKKKATKPEAILQPEPIEKEPVKPIKEMSKRTLQLREIALNAIKETEQGGQLFRRQR